MDTAPSRADLSPGEMPRDLAVRTEAFAITGIVGFALALRVWVACRVSVIFDDGPDFIDIARAMARGDFGSALAHPFHPLYPLLIWLTPGSAGHEEMAAVAWSVGAGAASVALVWWLMRPLFGARIALTAAALFAAHPYAVRFSADVQSDTVHLAFYLLGLGLLQRALARDDAGLAFTAGIAAALAYLARPEGVGVLAVGALLLAGSWVQGRMPLRRSALAGVALLGGFALLAVPYMRVIQVWSGTWQLTQKKSLLTMLGLGYTQTAGRGAWLFAGLILVAAIIGAVVARRRGGVDFNSIREWRLGARGLAAAAAFVLVVAWGLAPEAVPRYAALFASTFRPELLILLVIGIGVAAMRPGAPSGRAYFFVSTAAVHFAATFALLVSAGYLSRRHLLPLAVVLLGYAAVGLYAVAGWIARRWPARAHAQRHVALALVLLCIAIALPKTLRSHRLEGVAARVAAEWVATQAAPGDRIASDRPRAAYYAGLVWVPIRLRDGSNDGVLPGYALRRLGVRWVLATKRELESPSGVMLATTPAPGQRIDLVYEVERHGFRAAVFELREPAEGGVESSSR